MAVPFHVGLSKLLRNLGIWVDQVRRFTDVFLEIEELWFVRVGVFCFGLHDVAMIERLGSHFGLHPLALEDVVNVGQRPGFQEFDDHVYVITYRGRPMKVLVPCEHMAELMDIVDELSDPKTLEAVAKGRKAVARCAKAVPVHRICNRFGYVETRTPHETEMALREKLPKRWWPAINLILVSYGQHTCTPVSPKCSECPVRKHCGRVGVAKSR